jgi:hypothetical protein
LELPDDEIDKTAIDREASAVSLEFGNHKDISSSAPWTNGAYLAMA